ncbi:MAG TPA: serine hydrolase [Candidatus Dormibacteraeota bacterium]|nr:serine hydrolase [Candidatus Dormibacteraeota bacterium]
MEKRLVAALAGLAALLAGFVVGLTSARSASADLPVELPSPAIAASPSTTPAEATRLAALRGQIVDLLDQETATGAVTLVELGGPSPQTLSLNGDESFVAASTYKLPLLMWEAQEVTAGRWSPDDRLCYEEGDYEEGYYDDYEEGECFTRRELEERAGIASDNTAARILVREDGGPSALQSYARAHGAIESAFWDPNTTTTNDLARLVVNEAEGRAGGAAAQRYLYPLLTHTDYEEGIPAGVPAQVTVVHKIGSLGAELNDAGLVIGAPHGTYVLSICTDGSDDGWELLADISRAVWRFEAGR